MAMKATYGIVNGEGRELFKDPKTDTGTKRSAKGLLRVTKENGKYILHGQQTVEQMLTEPSELQHFFCNGHILVEDSLATIRARVEG